MSSELKTNKVSPATGTAFTLGDSGDTFTLPSGGTLTVASGATITNSGTATGFGTSAVVAVHLSGNQSMTKNVITKIQFDTEEFDTQGWWDASTNYRFTPTEAGYYYCSLTGFFSGMTQLNGKHLYIYKNGSVLKHTQWYESYIYDKTYKINHTVYLNGSSDYIEFYGQNGANGTVVLKQDSINSVANSGTFASIFKVD